MKLIKKICRLNRKIEKLERSGVLDLIVSGTYIERPYNKVFLCIWSIFQNASATKGISPFYAYLHTNYFFDSLDCPMHSKSLGSRRLQNIATVQVRHFQDSFESNLEPKNKCEINFN